MIGKMILEVCCGNLESIRSAIDGGADRVEVCCALGEGGLTPSLGYMVKAMAMGIPVRILIRPRRGDFCYTAEELAAMSYDISFADANGVDGIVIGALTPEGDIDTRAMEQLISNVQGSKIIFHRAFDLCRNPEEALETLIDLGCHGVLTSGQRSDAMAGAENLRRIVDQAAGRIEIIAGCGVNVGNVEEIIRVSGVREVHSSCSEKVDSRMVYRRQDVKMGNSADEYSYTVTDENKVRELRRIIDHIICR